mgnify:CR=1 FL=1
MIRQQHQIIDWRLLLRLIIIIIDMTMLIIAKGMRIWNIVCQEWLQRIIDRVFVQKATITIGSIYPKLIIITITIHSIDYHLIK